MKKQMAGGEVFLGETQKQAIWGLSNETVVGFKSFLLDHQFN